MHRRNYHWIHLDYLTARGDSNTGLSITKSYLGSYPYFDTWVDLTVYSDEIKINDA